MPLKSLYPDGLVSGLSFDERSSGLVANLTEYRDLAAKFSDQRIKAGRVLSAANRGRIAAVVQSVKPMLADLEALLAETDMTPPPADVASPDPESDARLKALKLKWLSLQYASILRTN
jgi:hypothetical protein